VIAYIKMSRDLEYEHNNITFDYQYTQEDGGGIKCKNYEICDCVLPKWWFDCNGSYVCICCDVQQYGELTFINNRDCPICLDVKRSVKLPKCSHTICTDCFKRTYQGDDDYNRENEPTFPYPDKEDEYYDTQEDPKWETDYPLIRIHNEAWNKWDDERQEKYNNEEYLRKCPICRK
jgi:hypothetical protein